jgi:hypothetical protein
MGQDPGRIWAASASQGTGQAETEDERRRPKSDHRGHKEAVGQGPSGSRESETSRRKEGPCQESCREKGSCQESGGEEDGHDSCTGSGGNGSVKNGARSFNAKPRFSFTSVIVRGGPDISVTRGL